VFNHYAKIQSSTTRRRFMNNYHDQSENEPAEQTVIISINGVETEFFGDDLTSPLTYAIEFLERERENGLEL